MDETHGAGAGAAARTAFTMGRPEGASRDGLRVGSPMAESPTTTLSKAAGPERDVLLATKLHIPRPRPGFLARPRLTQRLADGTARELVLVCTPAGFGKTTLLADWARGGQRPVAWLSLDEGDNDPVRFWRHVAAALDRALPGVAGRVTGLLGGLQAGSFQPVAATLVNELADSADEVVVVLDDYHLIQAQSVHESLGFLLEHLPASLRLVVASRADPPLPLARLRARGQLAELRERDLRFTPGEAAELLRTAVGSELPDAAVAALGDRTEGWVAGLQLAALSLQGRGDVTAFVEGFSGSHRYVLDYLTEEVLDRQPALLRAFLLETSVLERLSGRLCAAVTGRSDSQALLEQAERANLFLVPLDEVRGWWRYHHLFADLLRARLNQEQPQRVPALHQAAAAWSEQHGLIDDAIRHALAAGDAVWAARLMERHFDDLLRRCEDATLHRWLQALPAEVVQSRPRLCLAQALWAWIGGRLEAVEPLVAEAERAYPAVAEEPYEPSVGRATSLVANVPAAIGTFRAGLGCVQGDADRATTFGHQALAHLTDADRTLGSFAQWYLAVAEWLRGRLPEAEQALAGLVAEQRGAGERYFARLCYDLGQVQRAQGRLGAAVGTYQQALDASGAARLLPPAGMALVGLAGVLYERGELQAALDRATEGVGLWRQVSYGLPLTAGLATLAWIRQAQGDAPGALEALAEAERVQLSPTVVALLNPAPATRARLALARGEAAEAARWVQDRGLGPDDQPSYPREREQLVLVRVLLAQHRPDRALGLLERLHALAVAQGRTGSVIEIRALQALARQASGDQAGALAALAEALTLAAPEGWLRVFVDEGAPMAALLGKLLTTPAGAAVQVPPTFLDRLLDAFEQAGQAALPRSRRGAALPGLVAALSARELEVLQLLAAGRSNPAIAQELVVSLDTVKRHVTHILDKLGAANRTQAVARARELGLLR
jgi:LuxR family maltose regulon positive regulatory protein